jgi:hypothetical protein
VHNEASEVGKEHCTLRELGGYTSCCCKKLVVELSCRVDDFDTTRTKLKELCSMRRTGQDDVKLDKKKEHGSCIDGLTRGSTTTAELLFSGICLTLLDDIGWLCAEGNSV